VVTLWPRPLGLILKIIAGIGRYGRMRAKFRYSLQRTMIIYFLLIGFASVLVGVEFMADFHSGKLKAEIWENFRNLGPDQHYQEQIFAPIDRMRSKAMLMVGIIMLVMVIVLTMFIKNITEPLQHMIRISKKISGGDLSQTVGVEANNELADMGNVINEMASNLQEIILLSRRMCSQGQLFVTDILAQLKARPVSPDRLEKIETSVKKISKDLSLLEGMMDYFSFYSVDKSIDVR
jgi:methyl-accepting chemotaxis protein